MEKAGFHVHLLKKYVDDVLVVCSMAKTGQRINRDGILERDTESFSQDKRTGKSRENLTLEIL